MKLSKTQTDLLRKMSDGTILYHRPTCSYHQWTIGGYGYNAPPVSGVTAWSLLKHSLISRQSRSPVDTYIITEEGKQAIL